MPKAIFVTIAGITDSLLGHARRLGLSRGTLVARRRRGYSPEDALLKPVCATIDVDGEALPVRQAADHCGLNEKTVRDRIARGDADPLRPVKTAALYPYNGEMLTIRQIAEREGVSRQAIWQRKWFKEMAR